MIKWRKVDKRTGEPAKRNCGSFMPHDYVSEDAHLKIINNSFWETKNCCVLTTLKGTEIEKFNTLKAAKAYAETLAN